VNIDNTTDQHKTTTCQWVYIDNDDYYKTKCDQAFTLNSGTLQENNFTYCPYCGWPIVETNSIEGDPS